MKTQAVTRLQGGLCPFDTGYWRMHGGVKLPLARFYYETT
jgi:hypothetical protein